MPMQRATPQNIIPFPFRFCIPFRILEQPFKILFSTQLLPACGKPLDSEEIIKNITALECVPQSSQVEQLNDVVYTTLHEIVIVCAVHKQPLKKASEHNPDACIFCINYLWCNKHGSNRYILL